MPSLLPASQVPGLPQATPLTLNGFYPAMREAYLAPGARVHALVVGFEGLAWAAFRESVVGATDPRRASEGSLRAEILSQWEALGLPSEPTMVQRRPTTGGAARWPRARF